MAIEHSISYVRDNLEKIAAAGVPVRITRHGKTVGFYNPQTRLNQATGQWENVPRPTFAQKQEKRREANEDTVYDPDEFNV